MGSPGGFSAANHIHVGSKDIIRIEKAHDSSDVATPISALGHYKSGQIFLKWSQGYHLWERSPYLGYPNFCISLLRVSAY